mmetsp:Transcript_38692/g.98184  ORF Transcript_38692/g.98184 Transcript_38692/m.98184 type:complete len:304 (+) Transcript_38692:788-1699(+)
MLLPLLLNLLRLQRVDLLQDEGPLLVALLLLLHALGLAVLDLLDDNLGAAALALEAFLLSNLVHLQSFQALDLHHGVKLSLLLFLLGLHHALLLYLRVPDGDDLGVHHHLVHVLDIVHVLVEHLLRPLQDAVLLPRPAFLLLAPHHHVLLALLLHLADLLLAGLGLRQPFLQGLLLAAPVLHLLLLGHQGGGVPEPIQLRGRDHDRVLLGAAMAGAGTPELVADHHGVLADDDHLLAVVLGQIRPVFRAAIAEQRLVDVRVVVHGPIRAAAGAAAARRACHRAGHLARVLCGGKRLFQSALLD